MGYSPTPEQQAAIDAFVSGGDMKLEAAAGTGKTSTLKFLAAAKPSKRIIYLAYNKAIAVEAQREFPGNNVRAMTSHSLAYRWLMGQWGNSLRARLSAPRMKPWDTAKILGANKPLVVGAGSAAGPRVIQPNQQSRLAQETVKRFCYSADETITARHVPPVNGVDAAGDRALLVSEVLPMAQRAWEDMSAPNGRLFFPHDVYVKMYALSKPHIDCDVLFLDEAQDTNPALAGIVAGQDHAQRVAVGDACQAIYCQPDGTMVTVMRKRQDLEPGYNRCAVDGCKYRRSYKETGFCPGCQKKYDRGADLEPKPFTPDGNHWVRTQVPIEQVQAGDRVMTYHHRWVKRTGRPVAHVTRFPYDGRLVMVEAKGRRSRYTPEHHCVVRLNENLRGKFVVYLMRRGTQYRVGLAPFFYGSQGNTFGPGARAAQERADALWLLSIHDTRADAALAEALAQHTYNLPGLRFEPTSNTDVLDVRAFWLKLGDNQANGEQCLEGHGRLADYPLWKAGRGSRIGSRLPITTAAANLMDGFSVLVEGDEIQHSGKRDYAAPAQVWTPARVGSDYYTGTITSLEVEDHHTYFADGILTHNSWRGATDYLSQMPSEHHLYLSQSFRFGQAVADEANKWLGLLDANLRLKGAPANVVTSRLDTLDAPDAVLCRTNAEAVSRVIGYHEKEQPVALVGSGDDVKKLATAADQLKSSGRTSHPELCAFTSWGQVQEYVDDAVEGADLKVAVNLIDEHGTAAIINAIDRTVPEGPGVVTVSTAHKSKGREWDRVLVANDFPEPKTDEFGDQPMPSREDMMLAYVTVTRAKKVLDRDGLAWVDQFLGDKKGRAGIRRELHAEREDRAVHEAFRAALRGSYLPSAPEHV